MTPQPTSRLAAKLAERQAAVDDAPHVVVRAYAGTGKTFTEIVGVGWAFGQKVWPAICERLGFEPVPSDEQRAVWEAIALSRGKVKTITYCAFNKSIVQEFSAKWSWLVDLLKGCGVMLQFTTVNSLGNTACRNAFGRLDVKDWRTQDLLGEVLGRDPRELKRTEPAIMAAVPQLVGLCKLTLAGWNDDEGFNPQNITAETLDEIVAHHDIDLNGSRDKVYDLVTKVLVRCLEPKGVIDFDDQNWLPVVLRLPIAKSDLVLGDEVQDWNRCRQEFVRRIGRRLVLVGDIKQAIYGFSGADTKSIPRMEAMLGENGEPLQPLRLTETRRCGRAIVEEARRIVPDLKAHASNPEGRVRSSTVAKLAAEADDKDMVLCRVNAPLISQALRFIKAGRKAVVRGRDFGKSLIEFVRKLKAADPPDLIAKVDEWMLLEVRKESAKRYPSEAKLMALADRRDCVLAFADGAATVAEVLTKLDNVFAGKACPRCKKHFGEDADRCPERDCKVMLDPTTGYTCGPKLEKPEGVLFSSVHRAKGLEADRVFILAVKGATMPHPMAKSDWQVEQEYNCKYIAITRAIHELVWVHD